MLESRDSREATLSWIEGEAKSYAAPETRPELPDHYQRNPPVQGGPERICLEVTEEGVVRSGEMLMGAHRLHPPTGRMTKLWWSPLVKTPGMSLQVRALRLGAPGDTARSRSDGPTVPSGRGTTFEQDAFFPWGMIFPEPGEWVLVGTTNQNWGCFLITVVEQ